MNRFVLFIALLVLFARAGAQTDEGTVTGSFTVYTVQSLTITELSGLVSFTTPNDYFNGITINRHTNIKLKSNTNWILSFAANSSYFTPLSKGSSTDMPASVMGVRVNGQSNFKTLTTQSQKLTDGSKGSSGSKYDFDVDVFFNPGFRYSGGLYSIGVVYTLSKQ